MAGWSKGELDGITGEYIEDNVSTLTYPLNINSDVFRRFSRPSRISNWNRGSADDKPTRYDTMHKDDLTRMCQFVESSGVHNVDDRLSGDRIGNFNFTHFQLARWYSFLCSVICVMFGSRHLQKMPMTFLTRLV